MVIEDKDVPQEMAAINAVREKIGPLMDELEELLADHGDDCILRCFVLNCTLSHDCDHPLHDQ